MFVSLIVSLIFKATMADNRRESRFPVQCLVLEHRPEGHGHPQAIRVLRCLDFSADGMRFSGQPRFDRFKVTVSMPHDGSKHHAEVQVVHRLEDSFGVRFVEVSPELSQKLAWWGSAEPARNAGNAS